MSAAVLGRASAKKDGGKVSVPVAAGSPAVGASVSGPETWPSLAGGGASAAGGEAGGWAAGAGTAACPAAANTAHNAKPMGTPPTEPGALMDGDRRGGRLKWL